MKKRAGNALADPVLTPKRQRPPTITARCVGAASARFSSSGSQAFRLTKSRHNPMRSTRAIPIRSSGGASRRSFWRWPSLNPKAQSMATVKQACLSVVGGRAEWFFGARDSRRRDRGICRASAPDRASCARVRRARSPVKSSVRPDLYHRPCQGRLTDKPVVARIATR